MTDLHREFVQARGDQPQRRHVGGMAVTLNDLVGNRVRPQTQIRAHARLDRRRQVRERPHAPRELADADLFFRLIQSTAMAADLLIPDRHLDPERDRLPVHAVRPPDHHRLAMTVREVAEHPVQAPQILAENGRGLLQHDGERGVEDVGGRHPFVKVPPFRPHGLGYRADERQDVVLRGPFQFLDSVEVDPGARADDVHRRPWDQTLRGHRLAREEFDPQPGLILVPGRPERPHRRKTISINHRPPRVRPPFRATADQAAAGGRPWARRTRRRCLAPGPRCTRPS